MARITNYLVQLRPSCKAMSYFYLFLTSHTVLLSNWKRVRTVTVATRMLTI